MEERETYDDGGGEASRLGRVTDFNYLGKCRQGRAAVTPVTAPSRLFGWGLGPPADFNFNFPENK